MTADVINGDVAAPLMRRWGAADDFAEPAVEVKGEIPFAYNGTFDGLARPARSSWWNNTSWFNAGEAGAAAVGPTGETAVTRVELPVSQPVKPGGAVSQNRLCGSVAQNNPFKPTSSTRNLSENLHPEEEPSNFDKLTDARKAKKSKHQWRGRARTFAQPDEEAVVPAVFSFERGRWERSGAPVSEAEALASLEAAVPQQGPASPLPSQPPSPVKCEAPQPAALSDQVQLQFLENVRKNRLVRFSSSPISSATAAEPLAADGTSGVQTPSSRPRPRQPQSAQRKPPAHRKAPGARPRESAPPSFPAAPEASVRPAPPGSESERPLGAHAEPAADASPGGEWVTFRLPDAGAVYLFVEADVTPAEVRAWEASEKEWPVMRRLEISSAVRKDEGIPDDVPGPLVSDDVCTAAKAALGQWAEDQIRDAAAREAKKESTGPAPKDADAEQRENAQAALIRKLAEMAKVSDLQQRGSKRTQGEASRSAPPADLVEQLASERMRCLQLEECLRAAGIPVPQRPAVVGATVQHGSVAAALGMQIGPDGEVRHRFSAPVTAPKAASPEC